MKVAYFLGSLNRGGTESLTLDILRMHKSAPYEMLLIYRNEGNLSDSFQEIDVPQIKLKKNKTYLGYLLKMRRTLLNNKVDIIHAQTSMNAVLCVLLTLFTKIKVVSSFHGLSFSRSNKILRDIVFKGSSELIFVSKYSMELYRQTNPYKNFPHKWNVVHNGIDFSKIITRANTNDRVCIRLGMVGSFTFARNHIFICRFLKLLKQNNVPFHFDFIGGPYKGEEECMEQCKTYCNENGLTNYVSFLGVRKDIPSLLSQFDAFIYSTVCDTFGIAVLEAIATGLPTFVNDWSVMKETTLNGSLATIYKTNDENDLFCKFQEFLNNKELCFAKAMEASQQAKAIFSIENHISKLYQIYSK